MKKTVQTFQQMKEKHKKISMVTAYDYTTAKIVDEADIDGILVGDSLGMVCLGHENTLQVTMEDMIHHAKAVSKGTRNALLVVDMPFMSYQTSAYDAVVNAGRLVQEGHAEAIKMEGGEEIIDQIKACVKAQIPVMGHLGLTPQSIHSLGGYKIQGKTLHACQKMNYDAALLEEAGVFAIVLECIPTELAQMISEKLSVPTIGIGAGVHCDGQILVFHDMFGLYSEMSPSFVKMYENSGSLMKTKIQQYIQDVQKGSFPTKEHSFPMDSSLLTQMQSDHWEASKGEK
ncbi:MAG: 3-methyl-2-oxobutanoate hydroxymethyltransferase [Caldisericia bacterium]|nr:3-methyl-2-oxobutanoate hydroxymethyltransferase [Caldisericia bacterium]MDD4614485.1 3-methyl-2-oxobutanoate hydroxymethyltransferase [Caldisericia bacterium]